MIRWISDVVFLVAILFGLGSAISGTKWAYAQTHDAATDKQLDDWQQAPYDMATFAVAALTFAGLGLVVRFW